MKRLFIWCSLTVLVLFAVGELVARFGLGLGDPPLSVTHPRVEYMYAPNQDLVRFGNRQLYNEWSMRSTPVKDWGDDRRVLVFGDSVLNGGNLTGHERLATSIATKKTAGRTFANISAGSWGLDNILGWLEIFGTFDAEAVILVVSSHDAGDAPTFDGLNTSTHPVQPPISALFEAVYRYLPRYLPINLSIWEQETAGPIATDHIGREGVEVVPEIVSLLRRQGIPLCVVLHATLTEWSRNEYDSFTELVAAFNDENVPILKMWEINVSENPAGFYRDDIHINDDGQAALGRALTSCVDALKHKFN